MAEFDHSRFEPSADRGGEDRQFLQEPFLVDVVKASTDVRVKYPFAAPLMGHSRMDGSDGVHRAASRPETVGVRLEARLPFGFQGRFDDRLHHPVLHRRYAQGPWLPVFLGYVHSSDRKRVIALELQASSEQFQSGFGGVT